jgi:putative addiction module killer protein
MNILRTAAFDRWLKGLDSKARARILTRLDRASKGHFGDYKHIAEGVFEMRLAFGPGYRVYYRKGSGVCTLLHGGDKDSQARDIERALKVLRDMEDNHE